MRKLVFNCIFQGDVILNANTATEGNNDCLDFVPGSNFLGIAATKYSLLDMDLAYTIFHSGSVQFGDAHPLQNHERALRKPAAWFLEKGRTDTNDKGIYIHHIMLDKDMENLREEGIQLKQIRGGFFLPSGSVVETNTFFSLKSAHDRKFRRSKEKAMYGYTALRRGAEWQFSVIIPEEDKIEEFIVKSLSGEHGLGRSKSAQFGRVDIKCVENEKLESQIGNIGEVVIYASSRLLLLDTYGIPTSLPTPENMGLPAGSTIDFSKSQIQTYTYAPWNGKRGVRDSDRVCIEKGSVIVVNLSSNHDFASGIGESKSEGNGRVLLNPDFLTKASSTDKHYLRSSLKSSVKSNSVCFSEVSGLGQDEELLSFLHQKSMTTEKMNIILEKVNSFVEEKGKFFQRISSSQWGQIRSYAKKANTLDELSNELFAEETGFLMHGIREKVWRGKPKTELITLLLSIPEELSTSLLVNLASEMQKNSSRGESNHGN